MSQHLPPLKDVDTITGAALAAVGSGGITLQVITEFSNLALTVVNVIIALGGAYLLYLRIRKMRHEK
jgi:uncharacterized protein YcfJ